jgi:hypothetical protein
MKKKRLANINEDSWYNSVVIYLMVQLLKTANMSHQASRIRFVDIHTVCIIFWNISITVCLLPPNMLHSVMHNEIL